MDQPHGVFPTEAILEAILLQTEIRTLLTSATRVCRSWHGIIQGSASLQAAFFLKPAEEPAFFLKPSENGVRWSYCNHKSIRNLFIETDIWPDFFRKRLHNPSDRAWQIQEEFPLIDPGKEKAYLREEASWRHMLLRQPTSHLALIEERAYAPCPVVSQIPFYVNNGQFKAVDDFIRLGHLGDGVGHGDLIPGRDMLLFYDKDGRLTDRELKYAKHRAVAISYWLTQCDAVIFCCLSNFCEPRPFEGLGCLTFVDNFLEDLGRGAQVRRHRRVAA
ncbi:hypothetical protein ANOM_006771 [Aspergillus nomiae NRRL 13137]|uniref:F-box domain-containing protein n=1 Tax=Aspergillus nomiae NRRL (strain ATCC 15546 / NRRL 13137 / CBS 260.88 / M93) TaxID=1509407 RepID=A0A0L1IZJ3_ASPN3|nr:uncharacterized protein ANOM_006771 [Aspergillus nomiae NRRL 13137]KNG84961.1 hypothetical protein ANOM_006771 [Aspergillus nomiae NRRL 13137]